MNHRVLDFANFILEGLMPDADGHYLKRVKQRIRKLEIISYKGPDELTSQIDQEDAQARVRYLLDGLASTKIMSMDIQATAPATYHAISLGEIFLMVNNEPIEIIMKASDGKNSFEGSVFYAMTQNQILKSIMLFEKNASGDRIASTAYRILKEDARRQFGMDIQEFKNHFKYHNVVDGVSVHKIDMSQSFEEFKAEVDKMVGSGGPTKAPDVRFSGAAAMENLVLEESFRKEMVLSPGTKLTYFGKEGKRIEKMIKNEEPPAATKYEKGELTVFFEPQAVVVGKETKMLPSMKKFTVGQSFIVTPKNITNDDLEKVRRTLRDDSIELKDIQNAKFVGKITEIGQYSAKKYNSKFPVSYVRIEGKKLLL